MREWTNVFSASVLKQKNPVALCFQLLEIVIFVQNRYLWRHGMMSWKCHYVKAWLETVLGFLSPWVVLSEKIMKFKIFWCMQDWCLCHFVSLRNTWHGVILWPINIKIQYIYNIIWNGFSGDMAFHTRPLTLEPHTACRKGGWGLAKIN